MKSAIFKKAARSTSIAAAAVVLVGLSGDAFAQTAPASQRAAPQVAPIRAKPVPTQALSAQAAMPPKTQGSAPAKAGSEDIVARVGDASLSADDIRSYVAALPQREQSALAQDPALLNQAVRLLLANRLVLQELQGKKWEQQPSVTAQLERVREAALVELYLQSVSTPPANYPSDDELQKVYEANRNALLMPRQFQLAQIFIAAPKDADKGAEDKARKNVDDVQRKLKTPGADFAGIAGENGAKNGGALGWVAENQIRPEIRSQVMGLTKGAISEPVRLDDGWHILRLVDTKASYTRTLPEVRDLLVQQMRSEQAKALRQAYLGDLIRRNPPVLNEIALSKVLSEQTSAAR